MSVGAGTLLYGIAAGALAATALSALGAAVPGAAAASGLAVGALSVIAPPMAVIGAVQLGMRGVQLAFGSSEARVALPVTLMLAQRVILATKNIKWEEL